MRTKNSTEFFVRFFGKIQFKKYNMRLLITNFKMYLMMGASMLVIGQTSTARNIAHVHSPKGTAYSLYVNLLKNTVSGFGQANGLKLLVNSSLKANGAGSNQIQNTADNISFVEKGKLLGIDGYNTLTSADTITISVTELTAGTNYQLQLVATAFKVPGVTTMIVDRYAKTITELTSDTTTLSFTPTADTNTYGKRFALAFKTTALPIRLISGSAERLKNGQVKVNWNALGALDLVSYTIESSTNGNSFVSVSTVDAKNAASANYSYTDTKASNANKYYRIKATNVDGSVTYSKVLFVAGISAAINVYPNPVAGGLLHLSASNLSDAKYAVVVYDLAGKKVFAAMIDGRSGSYNLNIGKQVAGQYSLVISSEASVVYSTSLQVK